MADDDDDDIDTGNDPRGVQVRLYKMSTKVKEAKAQAAAAEKALADYRAEVAAQMKAAEARVKELEPFQQRATELEAQASSWQTERDIMGAGITDPEGVEFVRLAWGRLAPEARPKDGLKGWLAEGNRENLPKAVTAYMSPGQPAAGAPRHNPNAGVQAAPPRPGAVSTNDIASASRSGQWGSTREAVYAQLGIPAPDIGLNKS